MVAVVATVHGSLLHGIGTAIWSQGRAAFIAILRAVEVFCFAPIARNHSSQKKQVILARNPLASQRIILSLNAPLISSLRNLCGPLRLRGEFNRGDAEDRRDYAEENGTNLALGVSNAPLLFVPFRGQTVNKLARTVFALQ